jgi:hypothetical protein
MTRRVSNLAALASLLLFVLALVGYCPGSLVRRVWNGPGSASFVAAGDGGLYWITQRATPPPDGAWTADVKTFGRLHVNSGDRGVAEIVTVGPLPQRNRFGFGVLTGPAATVQFVTPDGAVGTCGMGYGGVAIPFWAPAILGGFLLAAWVFHYLSRYHLRESADRGLCTACGYDLRATPDRCPECGSLPTTRPT